MPKIKSMTLKEFIVEQVAKIGMDDFKDKFGVRESSINHWRRGACLPRAEHMLLIVKLSKGRVSHEAIIKGLKKPVKK